MYRKQHDIYLLCTLGEIESSFNISYSLLVKTNGVYSLQSFIQLK